MNLLFTGASGFLGQNIKHILARNYEIKTIGLTSSDDYKVDIANEIPEISEKFDTVLHAAGKAHVVPKTDAEKKSFFNVNLQGTKNICYALEKTGPPKSFIFISTVAVYGLDTGENITETHPLNGNTPYALSKKLAEEFLLNWSHKNNVTLSIIRPSLIAGPKAPGNLGALVTAIKSGKYFSIAGGKARKSVLMVQDIANLVPLLSTKGGIYNICDDTQPSFRQLEMLTAKQLNKRPPPIIPFWLARALALAGDLIGNKAPINSLKLKKITESLTFDNTKAKRELNWQPLSVLDNYHI